MERLTEWNESSHKHAYYPRCFKEPCYGSGCKIKDCPFETAVCERLAAYEDTGIEPEAVETVKLALAAKHMVDLETLNNTPISRLVELAEADKDGRVVVLPCKVGDALWLTASYYTERLPQPMEARVVRIEIDAGDEITYITTKGIVRDKGFGKTVFLTHEEAEKALKEMEDKKNGNETSL